MISDNQHTLNLKAAEGLQQRGYSFEYNADGYKVYHQGQLIHAAGVKLPRTKPLHWQHAKANRRGNLSNCIVTAKSHEKQLTIY